jgi:hypothetical protein
MAKEHAVSDPNTFTKVFLDLRSALDRNHQIVLTSALIPTCTAGTFLQSLPGKQLPLGGAAVTADDPTNPTLLSVTGRHPGPWAIPNIQGIALSDIDIRVTFYLVQATGAVTDTLEIVGATMALLQGKILLSGKLQPDATLALQFATANQATPLVALTDVVATLTSSRGVSLAVDDVPLFRSIPITGFDLRFGYAPGITTVAALTAQLNSTWQIIDGGAFALAHPCVSVRVERGPSDADGALSNLCAVRLRANMAIGSEQFAVSVDMGESDEMTLEVMASEGQVVPTLVDIAGAAGGATLRDAVQTAVQTIGLGELVADGIAIGFNVSARKLTQVTLSGHMVLCGGLVHLTMQLLPFLTFTGLLPRARPGQTTRGPSISVNALATQVLGNAADLPHIGVSEMALFAYPHLGFYSVSINTTEDWLWDLSGNGAGPTLTLQQLGFNAERSLQTVSGDISVTVSLGGFVVNLLAEYRGSGAGWLLSGSGAQSGNGVAGAEFVRDVAAKIGAKAPDALLQAVQGLRIVNVAVTIDTLTKAFTFTGETLATFRRKNNRSK